MRRALTRRVDGRRTANVAVQRSARGLDGRREGSEANAKADADAGSELLVGEDERESPPEGVVQESESQRHVEGEARRQDAACLL